MFKALLLSLVVLGSACVNPRAEREALLSDNARTLLSKHRQFMTQRQVDEFVFVETDEGREEYVKGLRIDERLALYSRPIQDAIWAQNVIMGMDKPAVLLSWGTPKQREFSTTGGNEIETWIYYRETHQWDVVVTNGYVTDVIDQGFVR